MKRKRWLAWLLIAAMLANHTTAVFAAVDVKDDSSAIITVPVEGATLSDAEKKATDSDTDWEEEQQDFEDGDLIDDLEEESEEVEELLDEELAALSEAELATSSDAEMLVEIPDEDLKQALIDDGYDTDGDGELSRNEMEAVTGLNADGYGISDLTGLEAAVNLECVMLSHNNITDLTPLQELANIYGYFNDNQITDISALADKTRGYIDLRNNQIEELPDLTAWTIDMLYDGSDFEVPTNVFGGNPSLDREKFEGKFSVDLTEEWLLINAYDDTEVLIPDEALKQALIDQGADRNDDGVLDASEMRQITMLYADDRGISDLTGLEVAVNLRGVYLSDNNITDLTPLQDLINIQGYFSNNQITDISPLVDKTEGPIYLYNNQIEELPDLTAWTESMLYDGDFEEDGTFVRSSPKNIFGGNTALDASKFEGKFSVELTEEWLALNAYDNTEVSIPDEALKQALLDQGADKNGDGVLSVTEMMQIEDLYASDRGISDLTGLETATELHYVNLADNNITDLTPLQGVANVYGNFQNNQITDITALAGKTFGWVDLQNNQITDITALAGETYDWIVLQDNQIAELPDLTAWTEDMLYSGWYDDDGAYVRSSPQNIFGGNTALDASKFEGKFSVDLTEEWLTINAYNNTEVSIPDEALKQALLDQGADKNDDGILDVSEMRLIGNLDASGCGISDLTGLEAATGLYYVSLAWNNITDLTPLQDLANVYGEFQNNQITDITPLANKTFGWFNFQNNQIEELPDLTAWTEDMLYSGWYDDDGTFVRSSPQNIFGGNTALDVSKFEGKFSVDLTAEWLAINAYNSTEVSIPDGALKLALLNRGIDANNDGVLNVSEMASLVNLSASYYGISDLTGLEYAVNLGYVNLSNNQITDLTPLQNLTEIYGVFDNNQITDISPLADKQGDYTYFSLKNNAIAELPDHMSWTASMLYSAYEMDDDGNVISGTPRTIFSGNNALTREMFEGRFDVVLTDEWLELNSFDTTEVNVPDQNLKNYLLGEYDTNGDGILSVSELKNITYLSISRVGVSDLTGLEAMEKLMNLYAPYNQISDISVLQNLPNLQYLNLCYNQISEVPDLTGLTKLYLYSGTTSSTSPREIFGANQIPREEFAGKFAMELTDEWLDLNSLDATVVEFPDANLKAALLSEYDSNADGVLCRSEIRSITWLDVYQMGIESLEGLQEMSQLSFLDADDNAIEDISPLASLTNLMDICLGNNQIQSIEALSGMEELGSLELQNNQITDISALENVNIFERLNLANNQITDISPLAGNTMFFLNLKGNQITDLSPLMSNTDLSELYVNDNQLTTLPDFEAAGIWLNLEGKYDSDTDTWRPRDIFSGNQITYETLKATFAYLEEDYGSEFMESWYRLNACDVETDSDGYWVDTDEGRMFYIDGEPVKDQLITYEDEIYYLDEDGYLVTKKWITRTLSDGTVRYMYVDSEGKAKRSDTFKLRSIGSSGKQYAFDSDGYMLYGWVSSAENQMLTGLYDWQIADYYFGEWNDGSLKTGWQTINAYGGWMEPDGYEDYQFYFDPEKDGLKRFGWLTLDGVTYYLDETGALRDSGLTYVDGVWYYFSPTDGHMLTSTEVTVGGVTYVIDENGVAAPGATVLDGWVDTDDGRMFYRDGAAVTDEFIEYEGRIYYLDISGYMVTSKWVSVKDEDGNVIGWRRFNSEGKAKRSYEFELEKIGANYYAFDADAYMLYGWVSSAENKRLTDPEGWKDADYYFGEISNGFLKTGWQTISVYGGWKDETGYADHQFYFSTDEATIGQKLTGVQEIDGTSYTFDENGALVEAIAIAKQPENVFGQNGEVVSFTVEMENSNSFQYQWYWREEGQEKWTPVVNKDGGYAGATEATLQVTASDYRRTLEFCCEISADGYESIRTNLVKILTRSITITGQPENMPVLDGESAAFTVAAEADSTLSYQWYWREGSEGSWMPVVDKDGGYAGAAEAALVVTASEYRRTLEFYCKLSAEGCDSVSTDIVKLLARSLIVTSQPESAVGVDGETVSFTAAAEGSDALAYQWYWREGSTGSWLPVVDKDGGYQGAVTDTLAITVSSYRRTLEYYCKISAAGYEPVSTETVAILSPSITLTAQPESVPGINGETVSFTVGAEGSGSLAYQWYWREAGTEKWTIVVDKAGGYDGASAKTLSVTVSDYRKTLEFKCEVSTSGCDPVSTETVAILTKSIIITEQPESTAGSDGTVVSFTAGAGESENLTYQWYWREEGQEKWTQVVEKDGYSGAAEATLFVTASAYRRTLEFQCEVSADGYESVRTEIVKILSPSLRIVTQPESVSAVNGEKVSFAVEAESSETITYQWYWREAGTENWIPVVNKENGYAGDTEAVLVVTVNDYRRGLEFYCKLKADGCTPVSTSIVQITQ